MNQTLSTDSTGAANTHEAIAAIAYRYYLEDGCPEGRSQEHWLRAERTLEGKPNLGSRDKNGVPEAEMSRFVGEGGTPSQPIPQAHPSSPNQEQALKAALNHRGSSQSQDHNRRRR